MEHHQRGNEGRLHEADNEPQREVTMETDVASAACLEEGGLSMEDVIPADADEPLQELGKTLGALVHD